MPIEIRVFGPGCHRCQTLAERIGEAARELGIEANIEEIHDPMAIAALGIMTTPALVVNGRLMIAGHVPSVSELEEMIKERIAV